MADKKTFLREGAFYQATDKALNNDMEMTSIVNNDDPIHPFVEAPAANAGGGGGGVVLQSPDDTLWVLGVNDSGVLQTTQTLSGTAGTLHLFSVDNTEWDVTVTNEGVLVTTAI